jgi:hypothetical protein
MLQVFLESRHPVDVRNEPRSVLFEFPCPLRNHASANVRGVAMHARVRTLRHDRSDGIDIVRDPQSSNVTDTTAKAS